MAIVGWVEKQPRCVCLKLAREVTEVNQQNRRCGGEGEFLLVGKPLWGVRGQAPMYLAPTPMLHRPVLEALGQEKLVELPDFLLKR